MFGFPGKGIFVLESTEVANATYVSNEDWGELSEKTRGRPLRKGVRKTESSTGRVGETDYTDSWQARLTGRSVPCRWHSSVTSTTMPLFLSDDQPRSQEDALVRNLPVVTCQRQFGFDLRSPIWR